MASEIAKTHQDGGFSHSRARGPAVAALAAQQHGVVAGRQLRALAFTPREIETRLARGHLHRVHRGVYAVGHTALTQRGRWMAAVLACGPEAALSHVAAAVLWGLLRWTVRPEVTAPRQRRHPGITTHIAILPPDERTALDGIPVTTVPRTVFDLAARVKSAHLERAMRETEYLRLTDPLSLGDLVARYPRHRGVAALRQARPESGLRMLRSDLELDFLAFLREHDLPLPASNIHILGFECDAVWHEARLIVELDSRIHDYAPVAAADRAKDRVLVIAGWRVIRVRPSDLGERLAVDLRRLLGLRPA